LPICYDPEPKYFMGRVSAVFPDTSSRSHLDLKFHKFPMGNTTDTYGGPREGAISHIHPNTPRPQSEGLHMGVRMGQCPC